VVRDEAFGVDATHTHTRILAFVVQTGLVLRAIGVQNTLWSAFVVRVTEIFWQTGTRTGAISFFALGVYATRGWMAGIHNFRFSQN
jgi:hypothetical protein